jgi:hypothetical protein
MRQSYETPVPQPIPASQDTTDKFVCHWVYWQPDPAAPNPEMPGLKQHVWMDIPVKPNDPCLCGSGLAYRQCCRRLPYYPLICANPSLQGYSLLQRHIATFVAKDRESIRASLLYDIRLQCVEDTPARTFWIAWGTPARETRYGIVCFGDIELRDNHTLTLTALSPLRMRWLLTIVAEDILPWVSHPTISADPLRGVDKQTGEHIFLDATAPQAPKIQAKKTPAKRRKK